MPGPHTDELIKIIQKFRDEELEHKTIAIQEKAHQAPFYQALSVVIQQGCRAAILVAKKI